MCVYVCLCLRVCVRACVCTSCPTKTKCSNVFEPQIGKLRKSTAGVIIPVTYNFAVIVCSVSILSVNNSF